jgi:hypothetical protein
MERVVIDVGDRRVRGARQVAGHVTCASNADEEVAAGARRDAQPDLAVEVAAVQRRGAAEVDVEVLGAYGGAVGVEALGRVET